MYKSKGDNKIFAIGQRLSSTAGLKGVTHTKSTLIGKQTSKQRPSVEVNADMFASQNSLPLNF